MFKRLKIVLSEEEKLEQGYLGQFYIWLFSWVGIDIRKW